MRVAPPVVIDDSQKETLRNGRDRDLCRRAKSSAPEWCCWLPRARLIWRLPPACASAIRRPRAGASGS